MSCLTDIEVQAVVDGEASTTAEAHLTACRRCRERVDARRRDVAAMTAAIEAGNMSPAFEARMRDVIHERGPARGATRLRVAVPQHRRRNAWISATVAAAATAVVIFGVLPRFGSPTTLSASEVLGKSLQTMTGARGVELLEYELFVAGGMNGAHRIEHLIDHDHPGRYRFTNYAPDGALESAVGQEAATGRRFLLARANGRGVLINFDPGTAPKVSLPEMTQALIETGITMMQANRDQTLTVLDTPTGRQYVIEMPRVTAPSSAAVLDLYSARAVVDGQDFRIQEFEATGSVLRQPYSVSFKLLRRSIRTSADVPAEEFTAPAMPGDVVINARADKDPATDVLAALVNEITRAKGR
jgi:hypothetical protein